jgi:hypothetical protein
MHLNMLQGNLLVFFIRVVVTHSLASVSVCEYVRFCELLFKSRPHCPYKRLLFMKRGLGGDRNNTAGGVLAPC